jgi:hypothetical protein
MGGRGEENKETETSCRGEEERGGVRRSLVVSPLLFSSIAKCAITRCGIVAAEVKIHFHQNKNTCDLLMHMKIKL